MDDVTLVSLIGKDEKGTRVNTLRTGDADLRFYITTLQDGWR